MKRIDKANWNGQSPTIGTMPVRYEVAQRTRAIAAGGIGMNHKGQWVTIR